MKRTVIQYIKAGLSGIMIEDQLSPKRCGHTKGKQIVDREEAYRRVKAAVDAREEGLIFFSSNFEVVLIDLVSWRRYCYSGADRRSRNG